MAVEHNEVGLGAAITVSFRDGGGGGDGNGDPLHSHSAGRAHAQMCKGGKHVPKVRSEGRPAGWGPNLVLQSITL